jgi:DNA-binding response OmpR family regulator
MADPAPRGRILCTEDDADTRDLLVFVLRQQGYEVICTGSPEDALALAKSQKFDMFLFDSPSLGG